MRSPVLMMLFASLLIAAEEPQAKSASGDETKIQGTWSMTAAVFDGKPLSDEVIKSRKMVFAGNQLTSLVDREKKKSLTYTLDPAKRPKQIDLTRSGKEDTAYGIYLLEGDELKLCYGEPGKERPTAFASKEGSRLFFSVLQRDKP